MPAALQHKRNRYAQIRLIMTQLVARLLLAVLLLPITGVVFVLSFALVIRPAGPPSMGAVTMLWAIVYVFVASYWLLLWRRAVRWTARRVGLTLTAAFVALLCGSVVGTLCLALNRRLPPPLG